MDGTIEKTEFLLVEIRAPAVRDVVEVIPRELTTVSDKKRNDGDLGIPTEMATRTRRTANVLLLPANRKHPMSAQLWRWWITALAVGMVLLFTSSTIALGQDSKPSGTVTIHQVQVAFIGSGTSGGGTLRFRGKNYSFKLGGLGIGGIGVSRIDASGTVYNLNRLQDFNGVYGQARTGWAVGKSGKGEMWLQNGNGVYLKLRAQRQGLSLNLGADGMVIQLGS